VKILLFISGLGNGGAERVFMRLLKYLSDAGHEVELISATSKGSLQYDQNPNIKILGAHFGYLSFLKYFKYVRRSQPDVVIATLSSAIFTASLAKFFLARDSHKLVCRIANVYQKPGSLLNGISLFFQKISLTIADGVICNSKATMKSVSSLLYMDVSSFKYQIINNPVLDDDYQEKRQVLRDRYPARSGKPKVFVFIGRFVPQKRVGHAIKAFAKAVDKMPNSQLIIVGDGPEKSYAIDLINKYQIADKVDLLDYCNDIPKLLTKSDCLINTSEFEGFGNVFVEGLAYCDNLISYRSDGGALELLPSTKAVLVPNGDINKMSDSIIGVFKQDNASFLATKEYLENFTASNVGRKYMEFIDGVVTISDEENII